MNQGIRRIFTLALVFAAAFIAVFAIRNGPDGFRRLFGKDDSGQGYRPEKFTLPEKAPLELDDVELLARLNQEYAKLTEAVVPSVVSIDTSGVRAQRFLDGYGRQLVRTQGQGSGVIVTHEGHVVTNYHVIRNQQQIQVTLHDGQVFPARPIGEDPLLDIAVLKIEGQYEFKPLKFGESDEVKRGQIVFAIGNPFGLGETITQGIISALERTVSDTQRDLFQTDAAINPGNSGGPLVNLRGEIIGINSTIYRPDERINSGFQGVGFSIPSNDVKEALYDILERGRPIRGYLGVSVRHLDPSIVRSLGSKEAESAAVVISVSEGSPAQKVGLKPRDVILSYDGKPVEGITKLIDRVQRSRVGKEVSIKIWRAGKISVVTPTIAESNIELAGRAKIPTQGLSRSENEVLQAIGITVYDLSQEQRKTGSSGVLVTGVRPESLASGKLQRGDLIQAINQEAIDTSHEFYLHLTSLASAQPVALNVVRDGKPLQILLPALSRSKTKEGEKNRGAK